MATLTKSTGTVTLSGTAEKVTLPAAYGWVWVKNMSDADMFVGLSADISEGADGVMVIPAGECGRIQTDGFNSIYLMGTGNALVVAQNYADCPFKVGAKGGDSPDLSAYAKKTDIPTELPANGGNADTLDNKHASNFYSSDNPPIKSTDVSGTTNGNGDIYFCRKDEGITPIFACGNADNVFNPFLSGDGIEYMLHVINAYSDSPVANTAVTATVYYF